MAAILAKGAKPIVIGGDHSITYPVLKAFARTFKPLDILHFDAHPDLYEDLYGDRLSHACPFARILEDGLAASVVQVGVRAITAAHRAKALKGGVRMVEMKDIQDPLHLRFRQPCLYLLRHGRARPGLRPRRLPSRARRALDPAGPPGHPVRSRAGSSAWTSSSSIPRATPAAITAAAAFKIIKETAGRIVRPS